MAGRVSITCRVLAGLWLTVILAATAAGTARAADSPVVNCRNPQTGVVTKTIRGRCSGEIVDDAEAERSEAERRAYQRRALTRPPAPGATEEREPAPRRGTIPRSAPSERLKGIGSAFFVTSAGHLVTNYHVIRNCKRLTVSPATGETVGARVTGASGLYDLALLKADIRPKGVAQFANAAPVPKATSIAIVGYPSKGLPTIRPQLTTGRADGTFQVGRRFTALQVKADVRFGNSGGPVLDPHGNVVGVVFARVNTPAVHEKTGRVVRDQGYAVPIDLTKRFLNTHNVSYKTGKASSSGADLLSLARGFVARVNCY